MAKRGVATESLIGKYISYADDGTNISILAGTTTILKYRKSDGQILLDASFSVDEF